VFVTKSLRRLACIVLLSCCARAPDRETPAASAPSASSRSLAPPPKPRALEPTTLFAVGVSAYAARLELDGEDVYLLTSSAAYRISPGRAPERWALDLGISPALAGDHLIFWSEGALRRAPKRGGDPEILAKVEREPQRLAASGAHVAWLEHTADRRFTIWTLDGSRPRAIVTPPHEVTALTLLDDQVFFVERISPAEYRLGGVPLSGGEPRYTPSERGRTPAMLAAAREIFYYDGPSLTVRRVSPDLERRVVVARDVICSPLAVAERIYCAQPAGLLELPIEGGAARVVSLRRSGPITSVAASSSRVAWLVDTGPDTLAVEGLAPP
jgi:hypothetical protein